MVIQSVAWGVMPPSLAHLIDGMMFLVSFSPQKIRVMSVPCFFFTLYMSCRTYGGDDVVISLEDGKLNYSWLANEKDGIIKMANILYKDRFNGNTQLNWDYQSFATLESNGKLFPNKMAIALTTVKKEVKLGITLNYIGHETEWETRTEVSNKYREVTVDDILRRFMSL